MSTGSMVTINGSGPWVSKGLLFAAKGKQSTEECLGCMGMKWCALEDQRVYRRARLMFRFAPLLSPLNSDSCAA